MGIFGGTFDPVHCGHLHLAETAFKHLNLSELRFIPLHIPPHQALPQASPTQRLEMLKIATENHSHFTVDDCEIKRGGITYTIDTLKVLRQESRETSLCMLMGIDSFNTLPYWRAWQSFLDYTHIIIVNRPQNDTTIADQTLRRIMHGATTDSVSPLRQKTAGYFMRLSAQMLDISSTKIRNILQESDAEPIELPDEVLHFIKKNHLYGAYATRYTH